MVKVSKPNHWRKIRMYAQFIKELIDLPDVLIQKVRKEEERWIFELSLPEQCPLCPVCLKRTIKMTGKKKQWMHGYAQRIGPVPRETHRGGAPNGAGVAERE
ncbi:Mobile element protein [Geobacillus stearothermophilus]|uniref:Mobile element protein n=1 Tax=Geobacillus stearothermophilus TaxID=1422 RepID=A0ABQ7HC18_GEOSE|nr:Mobile element protein [Geobacillus stearothermophilus]